MKKPDGWIGMMVLVMSLMACSAFGAPKRIVGTISYYGDPVQVTVPTSVNRGEDFEVEVTTYGGGCIDKGGTDSEVKGLEATVEPYDLDTSTPGYPCTADLAFYTHTVELRFSEVGNAQVRILGLKKDASSPQGTPITVTRTVAVR
jgi:hypothetical protein